MTHTYHSDLDLPAFCIQVIGFGKEVESVISQLTDSDMDEVSAYMGTKNQCIAPSDKDIMAILCVDDEKEKALQVAKTFYDADILTLIITSKTLPDGSFDSMTKVDISEMATVVKSLLDPIFLQSRICFAFSDLSMILRHSGLFHVYAAVSQGKDNRLEEVLNKFDNSVPDNILEAAEYIGLITYYNPKLEPPLKMKEIVPLNDYLRKVPDSINARWAIYEDEQMPKNEIRLSIILSGSVIADPEGNIVEITI